MRLATYRLTSDAPGTPSELPSGAFWARFGDEVLFFSDESRWDALAERAERSALRLQERRPDVEREHLHVVVQNGRLFQQEHPDVPVILDRGRFLLVELDPEQARLLEGKSATCYGVLPLREDQVVFDVRDRTAERAARLIGSRTWSTRWWAQPCRRTLSIWSRSQPATRPALTTLTLLLGRRTNWKLWVT